MAAGYKSPRGNRRDEPTVSELAEQALNAFLERSRRAVRPVGYRKPLLSKIGGATMTANALLDEIKHERQHRGIAFVIDQFTMVSDGPFATIHD